MTVVPAGARATVICDRCGKTDTAGGVTHDSDLVWPLVSHLGWTRSPFAACAAI